jgi:hypothetical protein
LNEVEASEQPCGILSCMAPPPPPPRPCQFWTSCNACRWSCNNSFLTCRYVKKTVDIAFLMFDSLPLYCEKERYFTNLSNSLKNAGKLLPYRHTRLDNFDGTPLGEVKYPHILIHPQALEHHGVHATWSPFLNPFDFESSFAMTSIPTLTIFLGCLSSL